LSEVGPLLFLAEAISSSSAVPEAVWLTSDAGRGLASGMFSNVNARTSAQARRRKVTSCDRAVRRDHARGRPMAHSCV